MLARTTATLAIIGTVFVAGCSASSATDSSALSAEDCTPTANAAYAKAYDACMLEGSASAAGCAAKATTVKTSAYTSCRQECPEESHSACTPAGYEGREVKCGTLELDRALSGVTCESSYKCWRTTLCDDYDAARADAAKGSLAPCPSNALRRVDVTTKRQGPIDVPDAVVMSCAPAVPAP